MTFVSKKYQIYGCSFEYFSLLFPQWLKDTSARQSDLLASEKRKKNKGNVYLNGIINQRHK